MALQPVHPTVRFGPVAPALPSKQQIQGIDMLCVALWWADTHIPFGRHLLTVDNIRFPAGIKVTKAEMGQLKQNRAS